MHCSLEKFGFLIHHDHIHDFPGNFESRMTDALKALIEDIVTKVVAQKMEEREQNNKTRKRRWSRSRSSSRSLV